MRREIEIVNQLGLHARPASEFVRCVESFDSEVIIWKGEEQFCGSSILGVMTANLECGAKAVLEAIGRDEEETLNRLTDLLGQFKRDEEEEAAAALAASDEPA